MNFIKNKKQEKQKKTQPKQKNEISKLNKKLSNKIKKNKKIKSIIIACLLTLSIIIAIIIIFIASQINEGTDTLPPSISQTETSPEKQTQRKVNEKIKSKTESLLSTATDEEKEILNLFDEYRNSMQSEAAFEDIRIYDSDSNENEQNTKSSIQDIDADENLKYAKSISAIINKQCMTDYDETDEKNFHATGNFLCTSEIISNFLIEKSFVLSEKNQSHSNYYINTDKNILCNIKESPDQLFYLNCTNSNWSKEKLYTSEEDFLPTSAKETIENFYKIKEKGETEDSRASYEYFDISQMSIESQNSLFLIPDGESWSLYEYDAQRQNSYKEHKIKTNSKIKYVYVSKGPFFQQIPIILFINENNQIEFIRVIAENISSDETQTTLIPDIKNVIRFHAGTSQTDYGKITHIIAEDLDGNYYDLNSYMH